MESPTDRPWAIGITDAEEPRKTTGGRISALAQVGSKAKDESPLENETLEDRRQARSLRKSYAETWSTVAILQIEFTGVIVILQGFSILTWSLSDAVLIALFSASTVNALAVVLAITKGLFKSE